MAYLQAEYPLPLYVNAALRDPFHPGHAPSYESGAPTDNNIELWKIAAPSISVVAPDIYTADYPVYTKQIELYKRYKNPLLIPETGNSAEFRALFCGHRPGRHRLGALWARPEPLQQPDRGAGGDGFERVQAGCAAV